MKEKNRDLPQGELRAAIELKLRKSKKTIQLDIQSGNILKPHEGPAPSNCLLATILENE